MISMISLLKTVTWVSDTFSKATLSGYATEYFTAYFLSNLHLDNEQGVRAVHLSHGTSYS